MAEPKNIPKQSGCVQSTPSSTKEKGIHAQPDSTWLKTYFFRASILAVFAVAIFMYTGPVSQWIVFNLLGFVTESPVGGALAFFLYDVIFILLLLVSLIYVIGMLRASLNVERVRDYLAGKKKGLGYGMGAVFGAVTPFCSCSSIPLFLGFTTARIPIGVTMSFLITSPLINEIAIVLLWGLLGWKFTLVYIAVGLLAGILGGALMDSVKADRWLQPFILEAMEHTPVPHTPGKVEKLRLRQRHVFAWSETLTIFKRVWKWVIMGVAIGAILHGFVPENWFAENLGAGQWWSVPLAVLVAIPLYTNVTGIVPVMESLLAKGLPIGTTMAFCMSAVAASLPEVMLLRQIMTLKLQALFIGYLWVMFTLMGWLFNILGPVIV